MEKQGVKRLCNDDTEENNKKMKICEDLSELKENDKDEHNKEPTLLDLAADDCFYCVFKYLNTYDLTNIANTCVRLQICATYVFKHYRKRFISFDYRTGEFINLNEVRDAVRIFGPHTYQLDINMKIFNKLFSSNSALSKVDEYCKSLDTIILNDLQFTKWFPAKYIDYDIDGPSDDDGWNDYDKYYDLDEDREWLTGYVSPKFLTNLPKVKNVIINKGILGMVS